MYSDVCQLFGHLRLLLRELLLAFGECRNFQLSAMNANVLSYSETAIR